MNDSNQMLAAVLYGKEDLRMEQVPVPVPGTGEIVIRVGAALTCGTDLKVYRRGYHAMMLQPPIPFGHELAGTVSATGEGVSRFSVGDRVVALNSAPCDACFFCEHDQQNLCEDLLFNNGAYAEYIRVPARIVEKNTLHIPEGVAFEHAALTEPLACVVRGLEETMARPGDTMIVVGAGPIGLMFMHAAQLSGIDVIAVVKREDQIASARLFGASQVVQIHDGIDIVAAARALTPQQRGADSVIEAVATPMTWGWAVDMVRKGGTVNFFGGPPSGTRVTLDTNRLHYGDITLKASFHHTPAACRTAFELVTSGRFKAAEYITGRASLADVPHLFHKMLTRSRGSSRLEIKTAIFPGSHPAEDFAQAEPALVGGGTMSSSAELSAPVDPTHGNLDGAPAEYLMPAVRPTLAEAKVWCRNLATTHYENFHVATWFLPKAVRPHFESVYAYCRVSDDLGDEVADPKTALRLLEEWGTLLDECYDAPSRSRHPVFVALHETIAQHDLPRSLFHDLLAAFRLDQTKTRYESLDELGAYSHDSANPVGRLVLLISGYREELIALLSDKICTALQLANFWQDVVEDWERGRRYLPADLMAQFGVTEADITARRFTPQFRALMQHLVTYTREMLREGSAISQHVDRELATTLDLFRKGGESILDAIAAQDFNTLKSRPEVSKSRKLQLVAGAVWGKLLGARS